MKAKPANVELVAKYESSKAGGTGGGEGLALGAWSACLIEHLQGLGRCRADGADPKRQRPSSQKLSSSAAKSGRSAVSGF